MNIKEKKAHSCIKRLLPALCFLCAGIYLLSSPGLTVQQLLDFAPDNLLAAAGMLLMFYALKSITFVFPMAVLEIVSGHLFPVWAALLVNFSGILIDLTLPYWIGYFSGVEAVQKLVKKHPKFEAVLDRQKSNSLFLCFFLRILGGLPADVVTMYFGATKTGYRKNVLGGATGLLPKMVLYTIWGTSIQEPGSFAFWLSLGLIALLSAGSFLGYYLYRRRLQSRQKKSIGSY